MAVPSTPRYSLSALVRVVRQVSRSGWSRVAVAGVSQILCSRVRRPVFGSDRVEYGQLEVEIGPFRGAYGNSVVDF